MARTTVFYMIMLPVFISLSTVAFNKLILQYLIVGITMKMYGFQKICAFKSQREKPRHNFIQSSQMLLTWPYSEF